MTFEEAVAFKATQPQEMKFGGDEIIYRAYVTPKDLQEFNKYTNAFRTQRNIQDGFAKMFSSDKQFSVYAICYLWDINGLFHKKLK